MASLIRIFRELRRRRLFKVILIYAAAAWGVIAASDVLLPQVVADPDAAIRYVFLVAGLLFPIALVFGWLYDITAEGIQRTPSFSESMQAPDTSLQRTDHFVIGTLSAVAVAVVVVFAWDVIEINISSPETTVFRPSPNFTSAIAVLPFDNATGDTEKEYLAVGFTEEIVGRLGKYPDLLVVTWEAISSPFLAGMDMSGQARRLKVDYILHGSIRAAGGDRYQINVRLLNASGENIWLSEYPAAIVAGNLIDTQRQIATEVASRTGKELGAAAFCEPSTNTRAFDLFVRGRFELQKRGLDNIQRAQVLFMEALDIDPFNARAHESLATAYYLEPGYSDPAEVKSVLAVNDLLARESARRALELCEYLGAAYYISTSEAREATVDWLAREVAAREGLRMDPNNESLIDWYTRILNNVGKGKEAFEYAKRAHRLNPLNPRLLFNVALGYHTLEGDTAKSLEFHHEIMELTGRNHRILERYIALDTGDYERVREILHQDSQEWLSITPEEIDAYVDGLADPSKKAAASEAVWHLVERSQATFTPAFFFSQFLEDNDLGFRIFEKSVELGRGFWLFNFWMPDYPAIRQDPRFVKVAESLGLIDYWRKTGWPDYCRPAGESFECYR